MEVLHNEMVDALLKKVETANYAVEHFLFRNPPVHHPYRAVANASLHALKVKYDARAHVPWKMRIDEEAFGTSIPIEISPTEFLGAQFNLTTKELFVWDYFGGAKYWFLPNETRIKENAHLPIDGSGYSYALLDPPHGGLTHVLFLKLCEALFGDLNKLEIYAWPTDCSNYFDDGKEWWGTFFWTVYSPTYDWYIGILASSTD